MCNCGLLTGFIGLDKHLSNILDLLARGKVKHGKPGQIFL